MSDKKAASLNFVWLFFIACIWFIILIPLAGIAVNIAETLNVFFNTDFFTHKTSYRGSFSSTFLIFLIFLLFWIYFFSKEYFLNRNPSNIYLTSVEDSAFWLRQRLHIETSETDNIIRSIFEKYIEARQKSDISIVEDLLWRQSYQKIKKTIDSKEQALKYWVRYSIKDIGIMYIESIFDNLTADRLTMIITYGEEWTNIKDTKENWIIEKDEASKQWILQDITPMKSKENEDSYDDSEKPFEYYQNNTI